MGRLHINKLIISGSKGDSTVDFGERLTLITGPSDTGKSYIFKSIYYLLGADKNNVPFDPSIGYDTVSMELRKGLSNVTVTRKIGDSIITVIDETGESIYKTKGKENNISDFYSELLDISPSLMIPYNADGQTQRFSLRTLKSLFMIREDNTETESPILLPPQNQSATAFLAGLLYILYEQDFSDYDANENKKSKAAKKAAVQKYILGNKEKLQAKKGYLEKLLNNSQSDFENITNLVDNLQKELEDTNKLISDSIKSLREYGNKIINVEDQLRGKNLLLSRYKALESQYIADIERLGFVVQGETIIHKHETPVYCPFCDNQMNEKQEDSYLEASQAEVKKILINSEDLSLTINDVKTEIANFTIGLEQLQAQRNTIQNTINSELKPQKSSILQKIEKYTSFIQATNDLRLINSILESYENDLIHLDQTVDTPTQFKPKELFSSDFVTKISETYLSLLRKCNFNPIESAEFDMSTFDIKVNGVPKKTHGKGYRALLNSLLVLSLREYINDNAIKNPHFYLIDSPLHGLIMPNGIEQTLNVRKGFFDYLVNNHGEDQIIIIENINREELPSNIDSIPNVKLIEFTQQEDKGRYGLLDGIRKN